MTAELKRCWMKKARWWDDGTVFFIEGAMRIHDRAAFTACCVDLGVTTASSRLTGRKLRWRVVQTNGRDLV